MNATSVYKSPRAAVVISGLCKGGGIIKRRAKYEKDFARRDGAIADFDRAIALHPRQADYSTNRGRAWLAKGEPDRALSDLNRALTLNPKLAEAWLYRGVIRIAKRDFARASGDFDEALKINPRLAGAYCNRGVTRLMQNRMKEAEADFARCRALGGTLKPEAERLLREARERRDK